MKKLILAASLLALSSVCAAQDVGVSINIGQPGFYGRIDIGNTPPPAVIYREPIIVQRPAHYIAEPLYLRVPPGHAKKWSKHCAAYRACGRQVYFVKDDWYLNEYAPRYRAEHGRGGSQHDGREHGGGQGKGHGRDKDHGRDKGHGRDKEHGNGRGHGNGNGRD